LAQALGGQEELDYAAAKALLERLLTYGTPLKNLAIELEALKEERKSLKEMLKIKILEEERMALENKQMSLENEREALLARNG